MPINSFTTQFVTLWLGLAKFRNQKKKAIKKKKKKRPAQPEWPERDRKILGRCMSRSPYNARVFPEDRVAVLWRTPAHHLPRYVKGQMPSR